MIKIKGVGLSILLRTPFIVSRWKRRIESSGFNTLVNEIHGIANGKAPDPDQLQELTDMHRAMSAYMRKIDLYSNPCQVISLALFENCRFHNINARLIIGINKETTPAEGHSWVEIDGKAINEDDETLKKFIRMMEV